MKNKYIKTINVIDQDSLNETIWINNNEVYKAQYKDLNKPRTDILNYHFTTYPKADADIFEFLKNDKANIIYMCYSYSVEDKINIDTTTQTYFFKTDLSENLLIKEELLKNETLNIGAIRKYTYNEDGSMIYLFEYFSNGKLSHIINFLDNKDNINDFDNPLEKIDWSQVVFIENPKEYYSDGLI